MRRKLVLSALLFGTGLFAACGGQVLSFGGTTLDWGPDDAGGKTLAELSDGEATTLCQWLASAFSVDFPGAFSPDEHCGTHVSPGPAPGWEETCAVSVGCEEQMITWLGFPTADCVANIRASAACTATPDDVVRCANDVAEGGPSRAYNNSSGDDSARNAACVADLSARCGPFVNDPACATAVFHYTSDDATRWCDNALPVQANAPACLMPSAPDGGP
jgi:hypothetical protein